MLGLAVLVAATMSFVPSLWWIVPRATMLAPMAPQFAAAAAMLGVVALLMRRGGLALLAVAALGWNLVQIWPDIAPNPTTAANAPPVLTVMSFNLWFNNSDIEQTTDALAASGADVIGLVEVTPRLKAGLAKLQTVYPYSVDCIGAAWGCQTMLLSKYPLKNAYAGPIGDRFPYVAIAAVERLGSPPVAVAVTHLSWPFAVRAHPPLVATVLDRPNPELPDVRARAVGAGGESRCVPLDAAGRSRADGRFQRRFMEPAACFVPCRDRSRGASAACCRAGRAGPGRFSGCRSITSSHAAGHEWSP